MLKSEYNQMVQRTRPPRRRNYSTGNAELDAKIAELIASAGPIPNADLIEEIVTTGFRLVRDKAARGEVKLINSAVKEFAYAFRVFSKWRDYRKISIFGSARTAPTEAVYNYTRDFAKGMAERNWMVITGAGAGIMAAGHEGAGAEHSFGASIRLPLESEPNTYIQGNAKLINFKYFFTRKVTFIKESDAFALLPGGFGTMDEAFELLTLMQTGKSDLHPIVLLEEPGSTYWHAWLKFLEEELLTRKLISRDDFSLVCHAGSIEEAIEEVTGFYRNYQSQRWVDGILILRLLRLPPNEEIERLAVAFADIIGPRGIRPVEAHEHEKEEHDNVELVRLAVDFNREGVGRLRRLIDELNRF
ncbi:MAG: LOG family protein [Chloroflexota bacterium]